MSQERELTHSDPSIECELPLGRPELVVHNELVLSGWAVSPAGISGVAVQIGERVWNAAYGLDSPAVAARLDGMARADRAGYRLAIDTSRWEPGSHFVTVAAFDSAGGRSAVEGAVEVRPFPAAADGAAHGQAADHDAPTLTLDSPAIASGAAEVEGPLEIRGWAHAANGVEAVLVTLDGHVQYEALRPVARPDLIGELGREAALEAGFVLQVDPLDCPPGQHRLTVAALTGDGRTTGVECDLTCRAAPLGTIDATPDLPLPAPRADGELSDAERTWRDRALLAESDAALTRAEARFARTGEERARRALARLRAQLAARSGRI